MSWRGWLGRPGGGEREVCWRGPGRRECSFHLLFIWEQVSGFGEGLMVGYEG